MRFINITDVCNSIPADVLAELDAKHQSLVDKSDEIKAPIITSGNPTWSRTKEFLENASHRKCWYTESKNPGCTNDVDHFRPKARIIDGTVGGDYWYWFLAFDPENYRLSCQFSNRLYKNPDTGLTGGKGTRFPLIDGQAHATTKAGLPTENPVLLDPCNANDCDLLEFQSDGRPVVSIKHKSNRIVCDRVEQSILLLNLNFGSFNEDREALYNQIKDLVDRGDRYGASNPAIEDVKRDLKGLMESDSAYSKAAECYIRCFRDREWIEQLI